MRFCGNCGNEIKDGAVFCPVCGSDALHSKKHVEQIDVATQNKPASRKMRAKVKSGKQSEPAKYEKTDKFEKRSFKSTKAFIKRFSESRFYKWYVSNWERLEENEWKGKELLHHLGWLACHLFVYMFLFFCGKGILGDSIKDAFFSYPPIKHAFFDSIKHAFSDTFWYCSYIPFFIVLGLVTIFVFKWLINIAGEDRIIRVIRRVCILSFIVFIVFMVGYLPLLEEVFSYDFDVWIVTSLCIALGLPLLYVLAKWTEEYTGFFRRTFIVFLVIFFVGLIGMCILGEDFMNIDFVEKDWNGNRIFRYYSYYSEEPHYKSNLYWYDKEGHLADRTVEATRNFGWRGDLELTDSYDHPLHIERNSYGSVSGYIDGSGSWGRYEYYSDGSIKSVSYRGKVCYYSPNGDSVSVIERYDEKIETFIYKRLPYDHIPPFPDHVYYPDGYATNDEGDIYISGKSMSVCPGVGNRHAFYADEDDFDSFYDEDKYYLVEHGVYYGDMDSHHGDYGAYNIKKFDYYDDGRLKQYVEVRSDKYAGCFFGIGSSKYEWHVIEETRCYEPDGSFISDTRISSDMYGNKQQVETFDEDGNTIDLIYYDSNGNPIKRK